MSQLSGPLSSLGAPGDATDEKLAVLENSLVNGSIDATFVNDVIEWLRNLIRAMDGKARSISHVKNIIVVLFEKYLSQHSTPPEVLRKFLENVVEVYCEISTYTCCSLMERIMCPMLRKATDSDFELIGRFELLATLNVVLSRVPSELRGRFWCSHELNSEIREFGRCLLGLGDFDLQAHATALLLRLVPNKYQKSFALTEFGIQQKNVASNFSSIAGSDFEMGIRSWLNDVNRLQLINPRVVSLPCTLIKLDDVRLKCPKIPNCDLSEFWLDFNLGSQRITAYCIPPVADSATQISGTSTQSLSTWEILTIYPELIEVLDIKGENQTVTLQFTLSEAICDICGWAPSITGNCITVELSSSAIDDHFRSIQFIDVCEVFSDADLVRILQQLQRYPACLSQESTSSLASELERPQLLSPRVRSLIATSPAKVLTSENHEESLHHGESDLAFNARPSTQGNGPMFRRVIASSPVYCERASLLYQSTKASPNSPSLSPMGQPNSSSKVEFQRSGTSEVLCDAVSSASTDAKSSCRKFSTPLSKVSDEALRINSEYPSPEKHRKADFLRSPRSALCTSPPTIADVDMDKSVSADSADGDIKEHAAASANFATPLECLALGVISTPETQDPQITLHHESVSLHEPRVCVSPCPMPPLAIDTQVTQNIGTSTKILEEAVAQTPGRTEHQNVSVLISSSRLSPSEDSTPSLPGNFSKLCLSSAEASVPGFRHKPARKLCDTSVSFLPDSSPAEALNAETPERITVLALPGLSAGVQLPTSKKSKVKRTTRGRKLVLRSSHSKDTVAAGADVQVLRRSDRLIAKRKPIVESSEDSSGESRLGSQGSPSPGLRSKSPIVALTQTGTPKSMVRYLNQPVSSLKKKKHFFTSSRCERMEREKKRFEEACKVSVNISRVNVKRPLRSADASRKQTSKLSKEKIAVPAKPSLTRSLNTAAAPLAMPVDSDSEFQPEIQDSNDSRRSFHQLQSGFTKRASAFEMLAPLIEGDCVAPSWESSNCSQHPQSNMKFEITPPKTVRKKTGVILETSIEDMSPHRYSQSSVCSLFATTPPRKETKPGNGKKNKTNKKTVAAPLRFVETGPWLDSNPVLPSSINMPEVRLVDLVLDGLDVEASTFPNSSNTGSMLLQKFKTLQEDVEQGLSDVRILESRFANMRTQMDELTVLLQKLLSCHEVLP